MFDRLGRRDDETPFVVQWFVQQGVEVWSTREGEQRFDSHVDKLMNYIRFWQASGESEKTSIRVRTKQSQMIQEGLWRGGAVPYGYKLEYLGRTNKKNAPVPDIVKDEEEAAVVKMIFDLITEEGYGTNRVANYLNDKGLKTKKGTSLWRGTSIRVVINNPICRGRLHFGDELSEPFEHLRIVSDEQYERCVQLIKARTTSDPEHNVPRRTNTQSLLTSLVFCGACGNRLCYSHNVRRKTLADGTEKAYERDLYRCYRKISSRKSCKGPTGYPAPVINEAVDADVRQFLARIHRMPEQKLVAVACGRNRAMYEVAFRQAKKEFENAQKQVNALEEEAVKALTGESQLDMNVVNAMLVKHRGRLEKAQQEMEEAERHITEEDANEKATKAQVDELRSWGEVFATAKKEVKQMILARLIDRIDVYDGYQVKIKYKVSMEQFLQGT